MWEPRSRVGGVSWVRVWMWTVDSVDCLESGAEAEGNKQPCPEWKSATGRSGKGKRQDRMGESRSVWGRPAKLVNNCAAAGFCLDSGRKKHCVRTLLQRSGRSAHPAACRASAPSQAGKLRGPCTVRMNTVPCQEPLAHVRGLRPPANGNPRARAEGDATVDAHLGVKPIQGAGG